MRYYPGFAAIAPITPVIVRKNPPNLLFSIDIRRLQDEALAVPHEDF
ncbi:hypothetical protein [Comamonas faecalis]